MPPKVKKFIVKKKAEPKKAPKKKAPKKKKFIVKKTEQARTPYQLVDREKAKKRVTGALRHGPEYFLTHKERSKEHLVYPEFNEEYGDDPTNYMNVSEILRHYDEGWSPITDKVYMDAQHKIKKRAGVMTDYVFQQHFNNWKKVNPTKGGSKALQQLQFQKYLETQNWNWGLDEFDYNKAFTKNDGFNPISAKFLN